MERITKIKKNLSVVFSALLTIILLVVVIAILINHVYIYSEEEALEKLHLETQQIKHDINLQMKSDRENLTTMANFAASLYDSDNNTEYGLLFESFEEIGLFSNIGILTKDNVLITKVDRITNQDTLVFEEEIRKGEVVEGEFIQGQYISGRVEDITAPGKSVVRSAVPVKDSDGNIVALMYGIIETEKLKTTYLDDVERLDAQLYVLEGGNGNFIINTRNKSLGNITELAAVDFEDGYTFEKLARALTDGEDGFCTFVSSSTGETLYAHYAPLDFADWQIMLMKPENIVFKGALSTGTYMITMASVIIVIMIAYVVFVYASERKTLKISTHASEIRKCLLVINQDMDKIREALKKIVIFSKARSAFVVDSYGEDYNYIAPSMRKTVISVEDRQYFIEKLLTYTAKKKTVKGAGVRIFKIAVGTSLKNQALDLYSFMTKHGFKSVYCAVITNNNSNTNLLGVINPNKSQVSVLLKEIAVCFSMAIYNKKHLVRTESMAVTDALTGVSNRMAYKHDVKHLEESEHTNLTCIYIDVNELNYYNNTFGHAAGDQMLVFVANTLVQEFSESRIYRMGGDEFLVFAENMDRSEIDKRLKCVNEKIEEMKYHISIGVMVKDEYTDIEELVNEAEKLMYIEKAKYYQQKDIKKYTEESSDSVRLIETGIKELDACIGIISKNYYGVYGVNLRTDRAVQLLAPKYFLVSDENSRFSEVLRNYIHEIVKPEYHRSFLSFLQYDAVEKLISEGHIPNLQYIKTDESMVRLTVHPIPDAKDDEPNTIWIFERIKKG